MNDFIELMKNSETLEYSFCISVILSIIISLLKYFFSNTVVGRDWGYMILELPIDVCLIVITVVITGYMKGETFAFGVVFVLISIFVSLLCCLFRRLSINQSYNEKYGWKSIMWGFFDVAVAVFWVAFVYNAII